MSMDNFFDRAHGLLDKAHEKMATASSQAVWAANQAVVIKQLEGQLHAVQGEIDRATSELGERTYQAWKADANDPQIPALCHNLDLLKNRRTQVSGDLHAVRAMTYTPPIVQRSWQRNAGPSSPPITVLPPVQAPSQSQGALPPSYAAPALPHSRPAPALPHSSPPPSPAQNRPAAPPQSPAPAARTVSAPPAARTTGPVAQPRECPNCGHFVPVGGDFCPSCGFRVV